jgi:hypothetical protein
LVAWGNLGEKKNSMLPPKNWAFWRIPEKCLSGCWKKKLGVREFLCCLIIWADYIGFKKNSFLQKTIWKPEKS